jgi:hypothetical protein
MPLKEKIADSNIILSRLIGSKGVLDIFRDKSKSPKVSRKNNIAF